MDHTSIARRQTIPKGLWEHRMIMGANFVIFGAYCFSDKDTRRLIYDTTALSIAKLSEHKCSSFILSPFTHFDFSHFVFNMVSLNSLGSAWVRLTPHLSFLPLALGAAATGNVAWLCEQLRNGNKHHLAVGASGMVCGVATALALLSPRSTFLLFGVVPVPAWAATAGFFAYDWYFLRNKREGDKIGHSAHIGGTVFGAVYYLLARRLRLL